MQRTLKHITREPRFRSTDAVHKMRKARLLMDVGQRADRNAVASTIIHATITSEVTAPAAILAFSFAVLGRSMSNDIGARSVAAAQS